MAKPLLPWKVTAHQPSLQSPTSSRAPAGIFASTSLVVFASARRFTVVVATPGLASALARQQHDGAGGKDEPFAHENISRSGSPRLREL